MKEEQPPTTLALVTQKVEPPLTKKELLRATAIAMHKTQSEKRKEALGVRGKRYEAIERIAVSLARKQMAAAKVNVNNIHYKGALTVVFAVDIDREIPGVAQAILDWNAVQVPEVESEETIYKRLQEASKAPERIMDMLKDAKFLKKLAEAGGKMLGKPTEADKLNAIPA